MKVGSVGNAIGFNDVTVDGMRLGIIDGPEGAFNKMYGDNYFCNECQQILDVCYDEGDKDSIWGKPLSPQHKMLLDEVIDRNCL